MEQFFKDLQQYFNMLNIVVEYIEKANFADKLPLFVSAPYYFAIVSIGGQRHVICFAKNSEISTPELISIQKSQIENLSKLPVIFVFRSGSKELCRKLIRKGVGFVIIGKQCYLPGKVVAFNEDKFDVTTNSNRKFFSPLTQMVFLYYLQERIEDGRLFFQDIISKFELNKVYVSRIARELQILGVAEIGVNKRNKFLQFDTDRKALWKKAQPYFINPVWKRIRVKNLPEGVVLAGISALAEYTNLNDDVVKTRAVYYKDIDIKSIEVFEFEGEFLELWKYRPLIRKTGIVDKLSLYLALKDDLDPRVQSELSNMMEDVWLEV